MMNDPAGNLWPPASNAASAAAIFVLANWNRNLASKLSPECSTTIVEPVPVTPPAARTGPVTGAISDVSRLLSVIGVITRLRIIGYVQPRSSYGLGFDIE